MKKKIHFLENIQSIIKAIYVEINAKVNSVMTYRSGGQTFCGDWLFSDISKNSAFIFYKAKNINKSKEYNYYYFLLLLFPYFLMMTSITRVNQLFGWRYFLKSDFLIKNKDKILLINNIYYFLILIKDK